MDIQQQSTQPISDDQELAKVLAGIDDVADAAASAAAPAMSDVPALTPPPTAPVVDQSAPAVVAPVGAPAPVAPVSTTPIAVSSELDSVKKDAISELRPLVGKLTLNPEEKFDTYLLLIRSTDDQSLIAPAHEAAKAIPDETRRAEALLDIIKEIDFLTNQGQPQA